MSAKPTPAGMVEVTRERFFELLKTDSRDVMPRCEREYTSWECGHNRQPWGWSSEGYIPSGATARYAVLTMSKSQ